MYLPPHFEETRAEPLHALVRSRPLGTLVTLDRGGVLQADPIPFLLDTDPQDADVTHPRGTPGGGAHPRGTPGDGTQLHGTLRGHVARANPLWRETRDDTDVLVVFQGAQGYVSPGWYPGKAEHGKVVPTWNYLVVQARGRLRAIDDREWLRAFVTRLTERHESRQVRPWQVADAPADYIETMLGAIVGIEIELVSLVGKWKASQNRSAADRAGVVAGLTALAARDGDAESAALAGVVAATLPPHPA